MTTRWLLALPAVFVGWISVMALVMILSDEAPAAVVLFPSDDFLARVPERTAVLARNSFSITVEGEAERFGLALYRAGGLLVLPAGLVGCLPLPSGAE